MHERIERNRESITSLLELTDKVRQKAGEAYSLVEMTQERADKLYAEAIESTEASQLGRDERKCMQAQFDGQTSARLALGCAEGLRSRLLGYADDLLVLVDDINELVGMLEGSKHAGTFKRSSVVKAAS